MSPLSAPARHRTLPWLACGLTLVLAMSTLAGGNGTVEYWAGSASTWIAEGAAEPAYPGLAKRSAPLVVPHVVPHGVLHGVPHMVSPMVRPMAAARAVASASVDAHPFAPGGDDLLPTGEADASPVPSEPSARPSAGADALQRAALAVSGTGPMRPRAMPEQRLRQALPLPVQKTSDDNLKQVDFDLRLQPSLRDLGLLGQALQAGEGDVASNTWPDLQTLGDFFQEGRAARWALAFTAQGVSQVYVLQRNEQGRWLDRSAELLQHQADRQSCHRPSQALTADFNADGKPDVYLACDGQQVLFLSQADGRYRRAVTPFQLSATQAQALDVDGDGLVDVITIDTQTGMPRALVLYGLGDGRFGVQLLDPSSELARDLYQRSAAPRIAHMLTTPALQGRP